MAETTHFTTLEKFQNKISKLATDNSLEFNTNDVERMRQRLEFAYNIIEAALMERGLTQIQVSTWKRGEEYQLDIATFWYAKDCGWGGKLIEDKDWTKVFNREGELSTAAIVTNDGVLLSKTKGPVAKVIDLKQVNENLGIRMQHYTDPMVKY
jgi:hypothetical protein